MSWIFESIPAGSVLTLPKDKRDTYIENAYKTPSSVQNMLFAQRTGSYIRGVAKTHSIPQEMTYVIAFAVLRVALGEKTLAQIPALLSSELRIANDKAQLISRELERDLFSQISIDLNQHTSQAKKEAGSIAEKLKIPPKPTTPPPAPGKFPRRPAAPPNILNLKSPKPGPKPPPIPR